MSQERSLERALALVQALHARTREGRVDWRETHDARMFATESGDFDISVRQVPDKEFPDQPDYKLEVVSRSTGRTIETISNVTLRPVMDRITSEGLNPYVVLEQTYEMARRKALRVDDALETILDSLKETK